eukprot:938090-Rhodomonas_salina.1
MTVQCVHQRCYVPLVLHIQTRTLRDCQYWPNVWCCSVRYWRCVWCTQGSPLLRGCLRVSGRGAGRSIAYLSTTHHSKW